MKYDTDKSGFIDGVEFAPMIQEFFQMLRLPSPSMAQCFSIMYQNDVDKDKKLSYQEFK